MVTNQPLPSIGAEQFPRVTDLIQQGIHQRLHHGMQVYVSRDADVLANFALGDNTSETSLSPETLMLWLSSGKPLTATAILQLWERGRLDLDAPVSEVLPEFAVGGKDIITPRHLLTHTAGLRPIVSGWPHKTWEQILERIIASPMQEDWEVGRQGAYDPARSWFVLGEMIHRVDGRTVNNYVREEILEPTGMFDTWMSMPAQLYQAYGDRIGVTYGHKDGVLSPTAGHQRDACKTPAPGSSLRGPASNLGRFYEMLLRDGAATDGKVILQAATVAEMTRRQRQGLHDRTFKHVVDFGLGLLVNSSQYGPETVPYGFGRYASALSFGHGGAQSSIGFADPVHGLVVVLIANGCPGEELHNQRFRDLASAVYHDLDLI